jgi:hypothetical protein
MDVSPEGLLKNNEADKEHLSQPDQMALNLT